MVESQCGICHTREGVHRCLQCHRPACDECAFKTVEGAFCSRKCATAYREYHAATKPEPPKKSRLGTVLLVIVLLVVVAALAYYIVTRTAAL
jgi:hypothetical protein